MEVFGFDFDHPYGFYSKLTGRVFASTPRYLVPGIVGGLIMGVGFIVGGFCPGTSLVAAITGKIDGILFTLGALVGMRLTGRWSARVVHRRWEPAR